MSFVLDETTTALPEGIDTVRLLFCDAAGVRRARAIPIGGADADADADASSRRLAALLADGVGLTKGCMGMPAHADVVVPDSGLSAVGEVRLVPGRVAPTAAETTTMAAPTAREGDDGARGPRSVLYRLPWMPSHAVAVADMLDADTGAPWACCSRAALRRVCDAARRDHGVGFVVGFELEFYLLRCGAGAPEAMPLVPAGPTSPLLAGGGAAAWPAADDLPYASSLALDAHAALLDEMVRACGALGQPVLQYHAESGPGQYELALAPHQDPVAAADHLLLAKEAVQAVAARRGYFACFAPKPFSDAAGSGMHTHVSLVGADGPARNLMAPPPPPTAAEGPLAAAGEHFVAGLLRHLPALLVFTAPSAGSYERLRPDCWAGAVAAYGVENRECPLRLTAARGVAATGAGAEAGASGRDGPHVEVKAVDGSCNPHVALAALLTAGLLGLRDKARLPGAPLEDAQPDDPPPARLPSSLQEAIDALARDSELGAELRWPPSSSLGGPLCTAIEGVRRREAADGVTAGQTALRY